MLGMYVRYVCYVCMLCMLCMYVMYVCYVCHVGGMCIVSCTCIVSHSSIQMPIKDCDMFR